MNVELKTGFLLLYKPAGITSFGCIFRLKKVVGKKVKIGHAGTLDPFASGLLIIAIGREATAMVSQIMCLEKTYSATAKLGELTDTLDCTGNVIQDHYFLVSQKDLENAVYSFGSSYEQIPPLYSALKHEGQPLYKLVRKKKVDVHALEVVAQTKKRIVTFYQLGLTSYENPFFSIKACVSHGTYIRSLMNDIAVRVGSCSTTYTLERSAIGMFSLEQAITLDKLLSIESINNHLISPENIKHMLNK